MKKVYLKLKHDRSTKKAIRQRLKRKENAQRLKLVKNLKSADMVVTSTDDLKSLPKRLPSNVKMMQIIDCGGAQRYRAARKLKIANATRLFERSVARLTFSVSLRACEDVIESTDKRWLQLGILGLGNIGQEVLFGLEGLLKSPEYSKSFPFDSIVISEVRDARVGWRRRLRSQFEQLDISLSWDDLDKTLMSSDILIVAAHRGPTADPLLGAVEAELINANSWVIDVSEAGVVDKSAFPMQNDPPKPRYVWIPALSEQMKESTGMSLDLDPKEVARFVVRNLKRVSKGRPVDLVSIPDA